MVYLKDSSQVGRGYNCTPDSPPTYTAGRSGSRPSGHSVGGTHYFPAQVAQAPGAATKHHPGRQCIKRHVHTSATCPQKSGREALPFTTDMHDKLEAWRELVRSLSNRPTHLHEL